MAATTIVPAKNGSRVLGKILQRLERGVSETTNKNKGSNLNITHLKNKCWFAADADPLVDAGATTAAATPVKVGNFVYREDTDEAFICSVAPTASTAGTFIQLHA